MQRGPVIVRRRQVAAATDRLPERLHPVLRRVYALRGVGDATELDLSLAALPDPAGLSGCVAAAERIVAAIEGGERIVVVGDYDADGATSSAVAVRGLRALGAADATFLVPNRFRNGYGLTPEVVDATAHLEPRVLVTVDNGISSLAGAEAARAAGIDLLVTDHHLPGPVLPEAHAIVNPQCGAADFPGRQLAGVGVIFYVLLAVRRLLRERGRFDAGQREPNLAGLLDLVALGTVADVAPLDRVNRTLVAQGLQRLRSGRGGAGLRALADVAGRDPRHLFAGDLGFALGPRLNAAGRLADMSIGVRCLLEEDFDRALLLAHQLDDLNRERREIERTMREDAETMLAALHLDGAGDLPPGLCLYDAGWHEGVVGILASRIKEQVHRPVVAFATAGDGRLRGSARSVTGIHVRDALQSIADRDPQMIDRFGGHAMAAGLSLAPEHLERFREAFAEEIGRRVDPELLQGTLDSDGNLAANEMTLATARALEEGGPWGQGFPEPLFDGPLRVRNRRVVGDAHLKLELEAPEGGTAIDAIAFNALPENNPEPGTLLDVAYRMGVNRYRGRESLQLIVEHMNENAPEETERR